MQAMERQSAADIIRVKVLVRERDGCACTSCGMANDDHRRITGRSLDVHRLVPGSEYTIDGCVTLCRKCHGSQPKTPRKDHKEPSATQRIAREHVEKLRAIHAMKREMGQRFDQIGFLNSIIVPASELSYEATLAEFDEFRRKRNRKK